jgi:hypothetical protein
MELRGVSFWNDGDVTMPTLMAASHVSMRMADSRARIEIRYQASSLKASADLHVVGTYRYPSRDTWTGLSQRLKPVACAPTIWTPEKKYLRKKKRSP